MNLLKKLFFLSALVTVFSIAASASAMTPTLSLSPDVYDANQVQFTIQGDPNESVILSYYPATGSGPDLASLGTTNASGQFNSDIELSQYNIAQNSSVSVTVNGQQSPAVAWTYGNTTSTNFTLSQGSVVVSVGQSETLTGANTTANPLYLASNSNSQVANVSISGNQIIVTGLSVGQTTANICVLNSTTGQNCASMYIVVQNSSAAPLSFSQNNTSIISGQNSQINISGGNGFYEVENNSNPSIITASFNGPVMTLYANGTTGTSTITVCSTDNSACGVVTASIGTYTTSGSGLSISSMYPTIMTGQTQTISISGGEGTYYLSSNSSTAVVQTSLSGNAITLYGNTPGTASLVVCAPSGECGTISATVVSASGGALTLSQESIGMVPGQVTSITISGGTEPYSLLQTTNNSGIAQYSLNGSVVTVTAVSSGASTATICSAGGACVTLAVTVSGNSATVSGVEPTFSQSNVSLNLSQTTAVGLSGNGGYYISTNSNPNSVSASISGSTVVLSGITVGSANISVCQTGGECNILYASVSNTSTPTVSSVPLSFSPASVTLNLGQSANVSVTGGSGVGYYVSYNSSPNAIGVYVAGSTLNITGNEAGNGTLSVCSSANICGSIGVLVNQTSASAVAVSSNSVGDGFVFNNHMQYGMSDSDFTGQDVTELQKRLTALGVYSGPITGYYGSLTTAAVERYQNEKGLDPIGQVGPATRADLNNA